MIINVKRTNNPSEPAKPATHPYITLIPTIKKYHRCISSIGVLLHTEFHLIREPILISLQTYCYLLRDTKHNTNYQLPKKRVTRRATLLFVVFYLVLILLLRSQRRQRLSLTVAVRAEVRPVHSAEPGLVR